MSYDTAVVPVPAGTTRLMSVRARSEVASALASGEDGRGQPHADRTPVSPSGSAVRGWSPARHPGAGQRWVSSRRAPLRAGWQVLPGGALSSAPPGRPPPAPAGRPSARLAPELGRCRRRCRRPATGLVQRSGGRGVEVGDLGTVGPQPQPAVLGHEGTGPPRPLEHAGRLVVDLRDRRGDLGGAAGWQVTRDQPPAAGSPAASSRGRPTRGRGTTAGARTRRSAPQCGTGGRRRRRGGGRAADRYRA